MSVPPPWPWLKAKGNKNGSAAYCSKAHPVSTAQHLKSSSNKTTMLKKSLFLLILAVMVGSFAACTGNEATSTEGSESSTTTSTSTTESATGAAEQPAEAKRKKASDPVARATAVFEQMGLELTPEQSAQVAEISSKYDLKGAPDRESRRALLQQFLQEVADNVLTPEQRVKYDEHRASQEEKKKNR